MVPIESIRRKVVEKKVIKPIVYTHMHDTGYARFHGNVTGLFYEY